MKGRKRERVRKRERERVRKKKRERENELAWVLLETRLHCRGQRGRGQR